MLFLENIAFKPTIKLVEERRKRIYGRLEKAEKLKREREELEKKYESSMEKARDEGMAKKEAIAAEGKKLYDEEVSKERRRVGEFIPQKREEILKKLEAELAQLKKEMEAPGIKIAETLLGRSLK